jgi:uncharacterized RDD family membrane protein YckC
METTKETLTIRTPEHVGFQYVLAGLGSRMTAFLVDTAVRWLFMLSILIAGMLIRRWLPPLDPTGVLIELSRNWMLALGVMAYAMVDLGYFFFFEAFWSGQTPGKRQQKLRVIRANGQPIGWLESAIRNMLRAVDLLMGLYPLGLIVAFLSRTNQRIGDYAAGTVVIVERRRHVPGTRTRPRNGDAPMRPEIETYVSLLEPAQYQLIRSFLERREEMESSHRRGIARMLVQQLIDGWGVSLSKEIPDDSFLEALAGLYERRKRAI